MELLAVTQIRRDIFFPLTDSQHSIWTHEVLNPDSLAYRTQVRIPCSKEIDITRLKQATYEIIVRHESLRTAVSESEGRLVGRIVPPYVPCFDEKNFSSPDSANQWLTQQAAGSIDLESGTSLFFSIARYGDEAILALNFHHLLIDQASIEIVLQELAARYSGEKIESPGTPSRPFSEFSASTPTSAYVKQRKNSGRGDMLDCFRNGGTTEANENAFDGGIVRLCVPNELNSAITASAIDLGITLNTWMLSAWKSFLYSLTTRDDLVVGCPVSRRDAGMDASSVGYYLDSIAFPVSLDSESTFLDVCRSTRAHLCTQWTFGQTKLICPRIESKSCS